MNGCDSEARAENPVERSWRAAALQVAEHAGADLLACAFSNFGAHDLTNSAQAVFTAGGRVAQLLAFFGRGPLRDDDHGALRPRFLAPHDLVGDLGIFKGYFRDENHIGAARETAVERDPTRMASHHFEHHDALVAGGRRVEPIHGISHTGDSRVEAERHRGGFQIVVNSLGHADDGDAFLVELERG